MEPAVFDFWERAHAIRERDPRFRREAYEFVMRGLEHTAQRIVGQRRHVGGQELLRGLVDLGRQDYGELAWAVYSEWGIERSEDFGAIVFHLVEESLLGRQPDDTPADFVGGIDLRTELEPPVRPHPLA